MEWGEEGGSSERRARNERSRDDRLTELGRLKGLASRHFVQGRGVCEAVAES